MTVCHPDPGDRPHTRVPKRTRAEWVPAAPLIRPARGRRSPGRPLAAYVREAVAAGPGTRVTVPIPGTGPERLWQRLLRNPRGAVGAHAVRRETDAVIRRLRFRLR
ncbi:hypothetical protein ACIBAI_07500 [Streptomyces sp. NPDC051041]|uniref:hypothetical protein n=1 Tax=Streptomyces sp. NPDC051041 TaxID=3365640 RepID=UPI0037B31802